MTHCAWEPKMEAAGSGSWTITDGKGEPLEKNSSSDGFWVRHLAAGASRDIGQKRLGSSSDTVPRHEVEHAAIPEGSARRTRRKQVCIQTS